MHACMQVTMDNGAVSGERERGSFIPRPVLENITKTRQRTG